MKGVFYSKIPRRGEDFTTILKDCLITLNLGCNCSSHEGTSILFDH